MNEPEKLKNFKVSVEVDLDKIEKVREAKEIFRKKMYGCYEVAKKKVERRFKARSGAKVFWAKYWEILRIVKPYLVMFCYEELEQVAIDLKLIDSYRGFNGDIAKYNRYMVNLLESIDETPESNFYQRYKDWFNTCAYHLIPLLLTPHDVSDVSKSVLVTQETPFHAMKILEQIHVPELSDEAIEESESYESGLINRFESPRKAAYQGGINRAKKAEQTWKAKAREILKASFSDSKLLELKRKKKILRKPIMDNWKNKIGDIEIGERQIDNFIDEVCNEIRENQQKQN